MTGQLSLSDWFPDCIGPDIPQPAKPKLKSKPKTDNLDFEYRLQTCGKCSVRYASPECFDRECAEKFHPVSPSKGRKPVIEIERKRRKKK